MADNKPTLIRIPEPLKRALKSKAATEGKSMRGVILELIAKYTGKEVVKDVDESKRSC